MGHAIRMCCLNPGLLVCAAIAPAQQRCPATKLHSALHPCPSRHQTHAGWRPASWSSRASRSASTMALNKSQPLGRTSRHSWQSGRRREWWLSGAGGTARLQVRCG